MAEVLDHFRAGEKIVLPLQRPAIGRIEGVVDRHHHARVFQHGGQDRPRPRAVIQAGHAGDKASQQRDGQTAEKSSIAGILRVVLMQVVQGLFPLGTDMTFGVGENQSAA